MTTMPTTESIDARLEPADVLIVGGGIAALETLLALHDLAGNRVQITIVAPDREVVYRPMTVAEPFGLGTARRYPLDEIAAEFGARILHGTVVAVDGTAHAVTLGSGAT